MEKKTIFYDRGPVHESEYAKRALGLYVRLALARYSLSRTVVLVALGTTAEEHARSR
jgi:hypothetical protein